MRSITPPHPVRFVQPIPPPRVCIALRKKNKWLGNINLSIYFLHSCNFSFNFNHLNPFAAITITITTATIQPGALCVRHCGAKPPLQLSPPSVQSNLSEHTQRFCYMSRPASWELRAAAAAAVATYIGSGGSSFVCCVLFKRVKMIAAWRNNICAKFTQFQRVRECGGRCAH